jgi:hypothetical protein
VLCVFFQSVFVREVLWDAGGRLGILFAMALWAGMEKKARYGHERGDGHCLVGSGLGLL